jgi:hypothetical protein
VKHLPILNIIVLKRLDEILLKRWKEDSDDSVSVVLDKKPSTKTAAYSKISTNI